MPAPTMAMESLSLPLSLPMAAHPRNASLRPNRRIEGRRGPVCKPNRVLGPGSGPGWGRAQAGVVLSGSPNAARHAA